MKVWSVIFTVATFVICLIAAPSARAEGSPAPAAKTQNERHRRRRLAKWEELRARQKGTRQRPVSGFVISCNYVRPRPDYPAVARNARVTGTVAVRVVVDEAGRVASAQALSGPPLLRMAAVKAAKESSFLPAVAAGGRRVAVSGVINYKFELQ